VEESALEPFIINPDLWSDNRLVHYSQSNIFDDSLSQVDSLFHQMMTESVIVATESASEKMDRDIDRIWEKVELKKEKAKAANPKPSNEKQRFNANDAYDRAMSIL
jgi:hypothetical protein